MTRLKVLAVDDEPGMRSGIDRSLENLTIPVPEVDDEVTFDLSLSESAENALDVIDRSAPDILLLDYKLPGMDGLELLGRVSHQLPDLITIMITAYASIETAVTATKKGAYDILPKPFTPADIKYMLRKAVTRILLRRRARELEEEKRNVRFEFIRVLGHELKAPLSAVAGYLHMFRDEALGDGIAAYGEVVDRSLLRIDQMRKLIVDLLDMTRIESGKKERNLHTVNLSTAAKNAAALVEHTAAERNICVQVMVEEGLSMNADSSEIDMILNNLVSNAVKYNRDKGRVEISITRNNGCITIRVADTGIGMTPAEMERLFGEFYRIKNAETRHILGSGLGLSILRKLADLYNGTVNVESEKGTGTVFTITLYEEIPNETDNSTGCG